MRSCRLPTDGICPLPDGRSVRLPQDRRRRGGDIHVPNRIERRGAKLFGDDFRRGFRSDAFRFALIALFTAAVRLFIGSLPVTLLFVLVTVLPLFAALTFAPIVVRYPLLILFALFGIVPLAMMWLLYASHLFDRTINRETYPGTRRRGLHPLPPDTTSETPAASSDAPSEGDATTEGNAPGEENDARAERSD